MGTFQSGAHVVFLSSPSVTTIKLPPALTGKVVHILGCSVLLLAHPESRILSSIAIGTIPSFRCFFFGSLSSLQGAASPVYFGMVPAGRAHSLQSLGILNRCLLLVPIPRVVDELVAVVLQTVLGVDLFARRVLENCCVALDQPRHDTTSCLSVRGQWSGA